MVARGWSLLVGMVLAECVLTKNSLNPLRTMVMNVRVLAKKFLQEVAMDKSGWNFLERRVRPLPRRMRRTRPRVRTRLRTCAHRGRGRRHDRPRHLRACQRLHVEAAGWRDREGPGLHPEGPQEARGRRPVGPPRARALDRRGRWLRGVGGDRGCVPSGQPACTQSGGPVPGGLCWGDPPLPPVGWRGRQGWGEPPWRPWPGM